MKVYLSCGTYFEKQEDAHKHARQNGTTFTKVEFPFAASPKADFVAWLNMDGDIAEERPQSAPEWKPSPQPQPVQPTSAFADQTLAFEDQFEAMPLPLQLHFAGLALENARSRIGAENAPAKARQGYGGAK